MIVNIQELTKNVTALEMMEHLQVKIEEVKDCAQALDNEYFDQEVPKTVTKWAQIAGSYHVLLIAMQWLYDLSEAMTEELTKQKYVDTTNAIEKARIEDDMGRVRNK